MKIFERRSERRCTLLASALGLMAAVVVADPSVSGTGIAIPIGPGADFTILSKATTSDPVELRTSGAVEVEFSELGIAPGGTSGFLARKGMTVVNVDDGVATLVLATDCVTRTVEAGSAVVAESVVEIRNRGSAPVALHLTSLTPVGSEAPTTAPCQATVGQGVTTKVLNRSTVTAPMTAQTNGASDVYVGLVRVQPGATAGPWHVHPGPVLVAVDQSQVTIKMGHGHRCEVVTLPTGSGFLEMPEMVHEASNHTDAPLSFYILGFAPSPRPLLTPAPTPPECQGA